VYNEETDCLNLWNGFGKNVYCLELTMQFDKRLHYADAATPTDELKSALQELGS
jgi:hypothetical protein